MVHHMMLYTCKEVNDRWATKKETQKKEPDRVANKAIDCFGNILRWISKSDTGS